MSDTGQHAGGCLCGKLRYVTTGKPRFIAVCHCRYCQRVTGSAFNPEACFLHEDVTFTGATSLYEHRAQHGRMMRSHFCAECGVTVGLTFERFPTVQAILTGTYDDPSWVPFDKHIFIETAMPWMAYRDEMDLFSGHCIQADGSAAPPTRKRV